MKKGFTALQTALLISIVALSAVIIYQMFSNLKSPQVNSMIMSIDMVVNSTVAQELFQCGGNLNLTVLHEIGDKYYWFSAVGPVECYQPREPDSTCVYVVGHVVSGRGKVLGLKVVDISKNEMVTMVTFKEPITLKPGEYIAVLLCNFEYKKFYDFRFVGNGVRTIDAWSTQVR